MNTLFTFFLASIVGTILIWGLRALPRENMQILATIPWRRLESGLWRGVNLTWYGVMQTAATLLAIALALVLAGSAGVPVPTTAMSIGLTLFLAMPSARLVARLVERRSGTFTVGGAVFVATLLLPWLARAMDALGKTDHALHLLGALAVAYPLGEGLGRLACISFGCCYGRPIDHCGPTWRRLIGKHAAVVVGRTRKAAYASGYEGIPLVPAPAMSAIVLLAAMGLAVFVYLGVSRMTTAIIRLEVSEAGASPRTAGADRTDTPPRRHTHVTGLEPKGRILRPL
jgi:hypothetical protein